MVLRNVPSTATFEEQRVEINELAADVDTLASNPDTLQTVTDRGFTTDNPIKIENYAATAFVVEDGSSNEKFVVDSVNGKVNVGSSAGGASGLYLFHNNSGATPAITLDGATGSITSTKGQFFWWSNCLLLHSIIKDLFRYQICRFFLVLMGICL